MSSEDGTINFECERRIRGVVDVDVVNPGDRSGDEEITIIGVNLDDVVNRGSTIQK